MAFDIYNACQYIDEAITEYQLAMESLIDSHEIYYKIGVAFYHKGAIWIKLLIILQWL